MTDLHAQAIAAIEVTPELRRAYDVVRTMDASFRRTVRNDRQDYRHWLEDRRRREYARASLLCAKEKLADLVMRELGRIGA